MLDQDHGTGANIASSMSISQVSGRVRKTSQPGSGKYIQTIQHADEVSGKLSAWIEGGGLERSWRANRRYKIREMSETKTTRTARE